MENDLEKSRYIIGGNGVAVLVDETAICRGRTISNPIICYDAIPNVT